MSPRTLLQHVNYVGKLAQEADARIAKIIAKLEEAQRDPNQALPLRERRRIEHLNKRNTSTLDDSIIKKSQYFYYKVELDFTNFEYQVYKEIPQQNQAPVLQRVGDSVNVIKWYEYGNP